MKLKCNDGVRVLTFTPFLGFKEEKLLFIGHFLLPRINMFLG
ncbi:hypothetical protein QBE52_00625 [Clostridiaceae bacterium 35-E11]